LKTHLSSSSMIRSQGAAVPFAGAAPFRGSSPPIRSDRAARRNRLPNPEAWAFSDPSGPPRRGADYRSPGRRCPPLDRSPRVKRPRQRWPECRRGVGRSWGRVRGPIKGSSTALFGPGPHADFFPDARLPSVV
jgi:hypothetical protein